MKIGFLAVTLLTPLWLLSSEIKTLIEQAQNSSAIAQLSYSKEAALEEADATLADYYPHFNIAATYMNTDRTSPFEAPEVKKYQANMEWKLFDGFFRRHQYRAALANISSLEHQSAYAKEQLAFNVISHYITLLNLQESLRVNDSKEDQLDVALTQVTRFYEAGSVSEDQVEAIKASLAMNRYEKSEIEMNIFSTKERLFYLSKIHVNRAKEIHFKEVQEIKNERSDIRSLKSKVIQIDEALKSSTAIYWPQVTLSDNYSKTDYGSFDGFGGVAFPDVQNKITLTASMVLFDGLGAKHRKEAYLKQKWMQKERITDMLREQKIELDIALRRIESVRSQLISAQASVKFAHAQLDLVSKKYEANLVDNVIYLNAVSANYSAISGLNRAKYKLELEKANYHFIAGNNLLEEIQ